MVFGFDTLNHISIIAAIDGEDCSKESTLGFYGLIIWVSMALYLMIGQFVICEEYFVPVLSALGDKWHMPEDMVGATLLAVGSSSPELFTAILGVIFYPHDNPGPGTNVGSAVFNMCIIVGLSAICAPRSAKLQIVPFLRDSIAYIIGLIELYIFYSVITPGYMDIWESILLTLWWIFYVLMVSKTDFLASRCCCCVPPHNVQRTIKDIHPNQYHGDMYVELGGNYEDTADVTPSASSAANKRPSFHKKRSAIKTGKGGQIGVQYDKRGHPITDSTQIHVADNIHIPPGVLDENALDEDLQRLLDELNRKQRQNVNKGWVIVVMPEHQAHTLDIPSRPLQLAANRLHGTEHQLNNDISPMETSINKVSNVSAHPAHVYTRRRTLIETLAHERAMAAANDVPDHDDDDMSDEDDAQSRGRGAILLHKFLFPWTKVFGWTLPKPEGSFALKHIYITIMCIITWLGVLTFLVVDCAEKIGNCFNIPGGLLGITLLAVGSSLPDCISSVIVARQMKLDMAVANAFGSNIFDVNLCVGFSFILGSIVNAFTGKSTSLFLGNEQALATFSELIIAAAVFMLFLWLMMWCTLFRLEKWIGYVLSVTYVGYICVFTVLFVQDQDSGDDFGDR